MNIKVYIKTTENNEICEINSEIFLEDTTGYIMVDEGSGDKYAHAQSNYLEKRIYDDQGRYNYKYIDGKITEILEADKPVIEPAKPEPTEQEKFNAQVMLELAKIKVAQTTKEAE